MSRGKAAKPKAQVRAPSGASVSAFVAGGADRALATASTKATPPAGARAKGVVTRVRKGELDRVTAYLPLELGVELRTACAVDRIELSEAMAEAVRGWLAKRRTS